MLYDLQADIPTGRGKNTRSHWYGENIHSSSLRTINDYDGKKIQNPILISLRENVQQLTLILVLP